MRTDDEGFTLIEMLVVLVLLGILAGIAVQAVGGISGRGDTAACRSDVRGLQSAQEAHFAKTGAYAGDAQALVSAGLLKKAPSHRPTVATDASGSVSVDGFVLDSSPAASLDALCG